jgi:hypothetical protein
MNIKELAQKYNLTKDDFWEVRQGTGKYAITHDACERISDRENITFKKPEMFVDISKDSVAMVGTARKGDVEIWATGEASPANCPNKYKFAMAEKRLKDRLTLKIINAYEYGIYSDTEAEQFEKPDNK